MLFFSVFPIFQSLMQTIEDDSNQSMLLNCCKESLENHSNSQQKDQKEQNLSENKTQKMDSKEKK